MRRVFGVNLLGSEWIEKDELIVMFVKKLYIIFITKLYKLYEILYYIYNKLYN